jgi:hypothetical protein
MHTLEVFLKFTLFDLISGIKVYRCALVIF